MSGNIFEGLVFCYAGVYKSLYLIKNDIVKNGGEFVSSLNPKVYFFPPFSSHTFS